MPSPKDITDDLPRLLRKPKTPLSGNNAPPEMPRMRPMAFDPLLWFTLLLLSVTVATQLTLVFWRW